MYVDEPGWIEISNDYAKGKLPLRLESIDPFVLSRGKRIRWLKNGGIDAEQGGRIHTKYHYSRKETNFHSYPSYTRSMRFNEPSRVSTTKTTRDPRLIRAQTKRDSSTANEASTRKEKSRMLERRNQRLAILDVLEQPYFISRGKKAKQHPYRMNLDASLLKEENKRKKMKVQLQWDDRDDKYVSNEFILSTEIKGSLLDRLLTKSDLFYANRGKRIPSKIYRINDFHSTPSVSVCNTSAGPRYI